MNSPQFQSFNQLPGPKGHFLLGSIPEIAGRPLPFFTQLQSQYGYYCRFSMGPYRFLYLGHPDHIQYILQENSKNYLKSITYDVLKLFLGEGLLTSESELWRKQRQIASPLFQSKKLAGFSSLMTNATLRCIEQIRPLAEAGQPINMSQSMMALTLEIVAQALFTRNVQEESLIVGENLTTILEFAERRLQSFITPPLFVPTPWNRRFLRAKQKLDEMVYLWIRERKQHPTEGADLLNKLLEARDEENKPLSEKQLRDELMTLILAGHETTANAMIWTWYLLSQYPRIWKELQDEWAHVLNGRVPTFEDLESLSLTQRVLQESMRLYPPVWAIERKAISEDRVDGIPIPPGTNVMLSPYVTHHDPAFWENPEAFEPDRFLP
ncbi:MAG: cytochrome P450, partial [Planctomycetota bacterium]